MILQFKFTLSGRFIDLRCSKLYYDNLNMRTPGMTLHKMPLFAWSVLVTAFYYYYLYRFLAGAITMLLTDRNFGTAFLRLRQVEIQYCTNIYFGFFGHPEVYILILPGLE